MLLMTPQYEVTVAVVILNLAIRSESEEVVDQSSNMHTGERLIQD